MAKLVWRVKLIAELGSGIVSETEVARIERDDFAVAETVGLTLDEGKRLAAAAQAEIVCAQVAAMGERFRWCEHCRAKLVSKGYYPATFRSVFGDVAVRVRRLCACRCRAGMQEPKSFSALAATDGIAPELAYITAKFAALAPFARVADLLSELLPIGGAANAGAMRNRTMRVGATVAKLTPAGMPMPDADAVTPAVIVGLDGGYVRSRHRRPERNFEVIAGKVLDSDGAQHRFAFARNGACQRAAEYPQKWALKIPHVAGGGDQLTALIGASVFGGRPRRFGGMMWAGGLRPKAAGAAVQPPRRRGRPPNSRDPSTGVPDGPPNGS